MILLRNFILFDFLRSYQSVPPNLAAGLDVRRLFRKKEGRLPYLNQPPSKVRPPTFAGVRCYWRPECLDGIPFHGFCDRVGEVLGWHCNISRPVFQQNSPNGDSMGSAR